MIPMKTEALVVLIMPSNDFNHKLGSNADVKEFCKLDKSTMINMTKTTHVKGPNAHSFFKSAQRFASFAPS